MSGYWPHEGYYVYSLAYPDGTVFYVGKGQGDRVQCHFREARAGVLSVKCAIIRSIWESGKEVAVTYWYTELSEEEALRREQEVIALFDFATLANRIKRGEQKWMTPQWLAKHSERAKENWKQIKAKAEAIERFSVRFPFDVLEEVRQAAKEDERPINSEIVWLLRQALAARKGGRDSAKKLQVPDKSMGEDVK